MATLPPASKTTYSLKPVVYGNVLVVEDDSDTADLCIVALAQAGFGIRKVANRQGALKLLEKNLYQVILMDVMMPGTTLDDFMSFRQSKFGKLEIILVSAYPDIEEAARKHGIRYWLKKPFDTYALREIVVAAIKDPEPL